VWYQHDVRLRAVFAVVALAVVGCAGPPESSSPVTSVPSVAAVDPDRIDRARAAMPEGFEFSDVGGRVSPPAQWGLGPGWTAEPPQCRVLAEPVTQPAATRGWSASGAGGIVYAVVAGSPPQLVRFDPAAVTECAQWTVAGGRTSGAVTVAPGPTIDGATTVAMSATATTVVEGGTETQSHAETVTAYVDDYAVTVTVVTDPGSPNPQLGQDFAVMLLAKSVAELRG
jgi:hypothetical protein